MIGRIFPSLHSPSRTFLPDLKDILTKPDFFKRRDGEEMRMISYF